MYDLYKVSPKTFSFRQITYNSNALINSLASGIPFLAPFFFSYKLIRMNSCHVHFQTNIQVDRRATHLTRSDPPSLPSKKPALKRPYLIGWFHIFLIFLSIQSKSIFLKLYYPTSESAVYVISQFKSYSMSHLRQSLHKRGFIRNRIVFDAIMPSPDTS